MNDINIFYIQNNMSEQKKNITSIYAKEDVIKDIKTFDIIILEIYNATR